MPKPSSKHLRLHIEDPSDDEHIFDVPSWNDLQSSIEQLIGRSLSIVPRQQLPKSPEILAELPNLLSGENGYLIQREISKGKSRSRTKQAAQERLMRAIGRLLEVQQQTRLELEQRETELATAIPVIGRLDDADDFNHRLREVLRGAVEGFRASAAALYLLDEETTQLKLRVQYGLPADRFLSPPRPLRGAIADLEALTGHAVVLEDAALLEHWNVPEPCNSAVCLPVSTPDTLLGTLWLFSDEARDYTPPETQLLEIIAGRIAGELERQVLIRDAVSGRGSRNQGEAIVHWHEERSRLASPVLDDWQVSGALVHCEQPRGDFHTWQLGDQDLITLSSAAISGPVDKAMLISSLLQGATRLAMLESMSPKHALSTINDVIWSSGPESEGVAMFYGQLDLATGQLRYLTAGSTEAYILRPHGWEPIMSETACLGTHPDWSAEIDIQDIQAGDVLLVVSDRQLSQSTPVDFCPTALAERLLRHIHLSAEELTKLAQKIVQQECDAPWARSLLIVKRSEQPHGHKDKV